MFAETWRDMKKQHPMKKHFANRNSFHIFGFHPHLPSYAKSGRSWWTQPPINWSTTCPWTSSTTTSHLGIAHNSTGPPKPSACVVGTEPCRCLSSRLLAHRSGLRTNITRSEAAKACLGEEITNTPRKNWPWNMEREDAGGRRDFIRKPSFLRLYSNFEGV